MKKITAREGRKYFKSLCKKIKRIQYSIYKMAIFLDDVGQKFVYAKVKNETRNLWKMRESRIKEVFMSVW